MLTDEDVKSIMPNSELWDSGAGGISGFGIRRQRSDAVSFIVVYRINQKQVRFTIGKFGIINTEQARNEARLILREVKNGGDPSMRRKKNKFVHSIGETPSDDYKGLKFVSVDLNRPMNDVNREMTQKVSDIENLFLQMGVFISCILKERKPINNLRFNIYKGNKNFAIIDAKDVLDVLLQSQMEIMKMNEIEIERYAYVPNHPLPNLFKVVTEELE